jgi:flagellar motor switch protein FliG
MVLATTTMAAAPGAPERVPVGGALGGAGLGLPLPGATSQEDALAGLTGVQRIAAFLIAVGEEASALILRHLPEEAIEQVTMEIFRMRQVPSRITDAVLQDVYDTLLAADYVATGGLQFARELIRRALGPDRAAELINRITARIRSGPFDFLRDIDPVQMVSFLQSEHPQTIALVLSHLPPKQAALVLTGLPPEVQPEVAIRIAWMDRTAPNVVREVDRLLRQKITSIGTQSYQEIGGIKYLVDVLNSADTTSSRGILDALDERQPELAEEIKKNMFVFDDVVKLTDRDMQRVNRELESKDLALALRGARDEVREKFLRNMSQRAAAQLKEDIELMPPQRVSVIQDAQQRIVAVIRRLEQAEEIVIASGGAGDQLI